MEKIIIGSDHGGFKLKEKIKGYLKELGYDNEDMGPFNDESSDYPDYAKKVAKKVASEKGKGILICGTGMGMCMAANKVNGIRAALAYDEYTAKMSREHNNSNILCLGERSLKEEMAMKIVKIWLKTPFSKEERHHKRVDKIMDLE
ncbi:ribose 5-phosphate isomerase B [Candidatus Pacearchaeota archaeon]|nr:ribose 5-phosphate isomerase B [Candidatus Pacearchaeota archaeon]